MRFSIGQAARFSGVSVRTLRYYDQIGLLRPGETSPAGARFYGPSELEQLRTILFYRELDFSLEEIRTLLLLPASAAGEALRHQRRLLVLKKNRLEGLIASLDQLLKGESSMDFQCFEDAGYRQEKDAWAQEAKDRWGDTEAYRESSRRTREYSAEQWAALRQEEKEIFASCAALRSFSPASPQARSLVERWRNHIDRWFYPCTNEILAGLGQMYEGDPRFAANIDRAGAGTAAFLSRAIAAYLAKA